MITRFKKIVRSTIVVLADRSCSLFNFGEIRDFAIFFLGRALCIELKAPFLFKSQRVSDLHLLFRCNLIWKFQKTSNNFKYVNRSVTHALSFSVSRYTILGILRWVEVDMLMPPCEDNEVTVSRGFWKEGVKIGFCLESERLMIQKRSTAQELNISARVSVRSRFLDCFPLSESESKW